jgi:hypothetical protein
MPRKLGTRDLAVAGTKLLFWVSSKSFFDVLATT